MPSIGLSISIGNARGLSFSVGIEITSGGGYAGSTYTAINASSGQWHADGSPISGATSLTYTMTLANEGAAITFVRSDGAISNSITMWTPNLSNAVVSTALDSRQGITLSGGVSQWVPYAGVSGNTTQATSAQRPAYDGVKWITFDGANDNLLTSLTGLTANMSVFMVMQTATAADMILFGGSGGATSRKLEVDPASASSGVVAGGGSPTLYANGAQITTVQRNTVHAAIATGLPVIFEMRGADMSNAEWASFEIGGWRAAGSVFNNMYNGQLASVVIVETPATDERQRFEGWLAWTLGIASSLPIDHPYKSAGPSANGLGAGITFLTDNLGAPLTDNLNNILTAEAA